MTHYPSSVEVAESLVSGNLSCDHCGTGSLYAFDDQTHNRITRAPLDPVPLLQEIREAETPVFPCSVGRGMTRFN